MQDTMVKGRDCKGKKKFFRGVVLSSIILVFFALMVNVKAGTLTVTKIGSGTGAVTSNPSGINCGIDCSETYTSGDSVSLTPTSDSGSFFDGWTGDCPVTGWNTRTVFGLGGSETSIHAPDPDTIYISYYYGVLGFTKSTDGGFSWTPGGLASGITVGDISLHAPDPDHIYISYYDLINRDLKFLGSTDGGSSWNTDIGGWSRFLDSVGDVGHFNSLSAPTSDKIYVGYSDSTNGDLKFTKSTNDGVSWSTPQIIATGGAYTSLHSPFSGRIFISYVYAGLKFTKSTNDGVSWSFPRTVDPAGVIETSITSPNGYTIYISYYSGGYLKFANSSDTGFSWTIKTVDSGGRFNSISAPNPYTIYISYYDSGNSALKFAKSTDAGDTWTTETIDSVGIVGKDTSIHAPNTDTIYISYKDETNQDLKLASYGGGNFITMGTADKTCTATFSLLGPPPPVCGDGICQPFVEHCSNCIADCSCGGSEYCQATTCFTLKAEGDTCDFGAFECSGGYCQNNICSSTYCGDDFCEGSEDCSTCSIDCGGCLIDGEYCDSPDECIGDYCVHNYCSSDITYCGDEYCEGSEDCSSCSEDCGKCDGESCGDADECIGDYCVHNYCSSDITYCGDDFCEGSETNADCPNDCCVEPVKIRLCPSETACTCDSGVRMCESDVDRACANDMSNSCDCTLPYCFIVESPTGDADGDGIDDFCDTEGNLQDCNDGIDNDGNGECDYEGCVCEFANDYCGTGDSNIKSLPSELACAAHCQSCDACGGDWWDLNLCDAGECSDCGLCSYNSIIGEAIGSCCSDDDQDTVCNAVDICPGEDDRMDADDDGIPDACDTENNLQDCNDGIDNDGNGECDYEGCVCEFANDYCGTGDSNIKSLPSELACATYCPDDDQDTVCNAVDICPGGDDGADADGDGTPDACDTENTQTDCKDGIDNDGDGGCDYFGCPGIPDGDSDCEYLGLPSSTDGLSSGLPLDLPPDMDLTDYVDQINTQNQALLRAGCPLLY